MANKPSNKKEEVKSTSVAKSNNSEALVLVQDQVPEHLQGKTTGAGRGSENVHQDDLIIPRLEVTQALSHALDKSHAQFVKGAEAGDLINSVSRQNYGKEVFVVPVSYNKQWLVWKDISRGGGFLGSFPDPEAAGVKVEEEGGKKAGIEAIDTPTHLCLLVNRNSGSVDEIMIPMPKTKAKVSRAWNSMVRMAGGDRFARVYRIGSAQETNKVNQAYQNFTIAQSGFPAKQLYDLAEKLYKQIAAGEKKVVMDVKDYDDVTDENGDM